MGSVKAGNFQTAICTILGFFGCKWILLEVLFALLSQNRLLGGKYVLLLLVGLVLTMGIDVQENRCTASKRKPSKDNAVTSDSEAGNTESADKNSKCA